MMTHCCKHHQTLWGFGGNNIIIIDKDAWHLLKWAPASQTTQSTQSFCWSLINLFCIKLKKLAVNDTAFKFCFISPHKRPLMSGLFTFESGPLWTNLLESPALQSIEQSGGGVSGPTPTMALCRAHFNEHPKCHVITLVGLEVCWFSGNYYL